ncbi:histidine phosphatase family protein [Wukongibacter baidiensis]|uniref:histidine phosphatase family protein n=1 Tax=Wukongibacter baidiensis TaxID=1723361 RepID=UPI003D7F4F08
MRIGLVRHFKVKMKLPKKAFISRDELSTWLDEYDKADVECEQVDLCNVSWKSCYSSDMPRAVKTAENIYSGNITILQGLREFNPIPLFERNHRLPFLFWVVLIQFEKLKSNRCLSEYKNQIESCLNEILLESDEDILIVSHGFAMICLKEELKKRGFKGVNFKLPANGKLYIFEK